MHETRAFTPVEVRLAAGEADAGIVTGYGSTFGGAPDVYGDVIAPGAFARSLAEHRSAGTLPAMLWSHDPSAVIGRWTSMVEDACGLRVTGRLNLDTAAGRDAQAHLKAGDVSGLSIGFVTRDAAPGSGRVGEARRIIKAADLHEVSVVAMPANTRARVTSIKSLGGPRDVERILAEAGVPRSAAKALASGGWPALHTTAPALETLGARIDAALDELRNPKG